MPMPNDSLLEALRDFDIVKADGAPWFRIVSDPGKARVELQHIDGDVAKLDEELAGVVAGFRGRSPPTTETILALQSVVLGALQRAVFDGRLRPLSNGRWLAG